MNTQAAEKLVRDLQVLVGDTEELVRATADHANERVVSARTKATESLHLIQAALQSKHAAANDDRQLQVPKIVRDNTWKLAGIAAGAGLLLGLILGRPPRR